MKRWHKVGIGCGVIALGALGLLVAFIVILLIWAKDPSSEVVVAASHGDAAAVIQALDAGADINAVMPVTGLTALHEATDNGHIEVVRILIDRGANVHSTTGITANGAIHIAAKRGHVEIIAMLLEAGADVNQKNRNGRTPLAYAEATEQTAAAEYLRSEGGGF